MLRITIILCLLWPSLALAFVESDSMAVEATLNRLPAAERLSFLQTEVLRTLRNDPRLALAIARRTLVVATELNNVVAQNQSLMDIGVALYFLGDYRNALRRYEEALVIAETLGDKVRIGAGEQAGHHLNHRNPGAQGRVHGS